MEHTFISVAAAFVYCYGKEPGSKAAFAAEFFQAEKHGEKDILNDIFDLAGPAEQSVGQDRNISGVSFDNPVEGSLISPAELFDQEFIINGFGHNQYIRQGNQGKLTKKMEKLCKCGVSVTKNKKPGNQTGFL
jgi:hypothetical protein